MPHETALIATIAIGLGLAFILGLLAVRLRLPPLVGYLVAGILVGPHTPGLYADVHLAQQLAEIGVILLMFGVGVHFSLGDLLAVRRIAVPGAAVQITLATVLGAAISRLWDWPWGSGIVFGLCLSVASTVVLLRSLEDRGQLHTMDGQIAVGWLVVEDLATVLVLVLLPALAVTLGGVDNGEAATGGAGIAMALLTTIGKVAAFVVLMIVVGRRAVPWLLQRVARIGSRELFTLSVLAVALGIAVGASVLFDVSVALGAFFAGMVVNGSDLSHEAAADALPLQDAFSVLCFVAVGMLFDPAILVREPLEVLGVLFIILVGKTVGAFGIVLGFRYPIHTALTISASLAQIGEFSFILAALGVQLGVLPVEGQSLIVAGALLSIALNPGAFALIAPIKRWMERHPRLLALVERTEPDAPVTVLDTEGVHDHAIIVGFGRVGSTIGSVLEREGIAYVAVEQDRLRFESLRERGIPAVFGNAARALVLESAHPERARLLLVTTPDPFQSRAVVEIARRANPNIPAIIRTHSEEERQWLETNGIGTAIMGEHELALTMARRALDAGRPVE
jgi:CPA2 family monovalent cation:H+ antiporter-2